MKADFLCLGFQKCGTTTLYDLFKQHRGMILTRDVKEPMYYRVKGARFFGGKNWYDRRYFGHVRHKNGKLTGEINAGLTFTDCARKIGRDFSENTKLIFMMRNPADRAYSAYKYFLARGFLPWSVTAADMIKGHAKTFHKYVEKTLSSEKACKEIMEKRLKYLVFSQGNYGDCIREYQEYFAEENMKFIFFEEFIQNQKQSCMELYDFLGIEADEKIQYGLKSNEGNFRAVSPFFAKLGLLFTGADYGFFEFLNLSRLAPGFYRNFKKLNEKVQGMCLKEETDHSKMLPETRKLLEEYYRAQKEDVERITGRDLSEIWY